jgi:pullulanase/glycogen debranching enzyme
MISEGQEFARSKVIPQNISEQDSHKGMIDHNSYDKDNETNYINYNHASINSDLLTYYKGLIELRKKYEAFRRASYNDVKFISFTDNPFVIGYYLKYKKEVFIVVLNANTKLNFEYNLPDGDWEILVNDSSAGVNSIGKVEKHIKINSSTGIVLKRR